MLSQLSISFTISPTSQRRSVNPQAIAGDIRTAELLEDETRVLTQRGLQAGIGMSTSGGSRGAHRLAQFIEGLAEKGVNCADLAVRIRNPILFRYSKVGKMAYGYEATILADICDAVLGSKPQKVRTGGPHFARPSYPTPVFPEYTWRDFCREPLYSSGVSHTDHPAVRTERNPLPIMCVLRQTICCLRTISGLARFVSAVVSEDAAKPQGIVGLEMPQIASRSVTHRLGVSGNDSN